MTNYYVANAPTGNDGNSGLLGYPWATIAKVNASSFSAGDNIYFNRGDTWREQLTVPDSGDSNDQITFSAYGSGNLPKIYGSTQQSTWEYYQDGQWRTSLGSMPISVWFINTDDSISWGKKETVLANVNAEYDWYQGGGYLYCYTGGSGSEYDPDTRYNSIEASSRADSIFSSGKDYIAISYLEIAFGANRLIRTWNCDNWIIEYCHIHHVGTKTTTAAAIKINGSDNIVRHNEVSDGFMNILIAAQTQATDDNIVEYNDSYDAFHANLELGNYGSLVTADGNIFRYNLVYSTDDYDPVDVGNGLFFRSYSASGTEIITNTKAYYNVFFNLKGDFIYIEEGITGIEIYNNTLYKSHSAATSSNGILVKSQTGIEINTVKIKNNIAVDMYNSCFRVVSVGGGSGVTECDYNCWYQSAGGNAIYANITGEPGTPYHYDDFATYQSDTGWDTYGLWESPSFVDKANDDFNLASGSPCIDAGVDVGLTEDYEGSVVPQGSGYDMGAYEAETTGIDIHAILRRG